MGPTTMGLVHLMDTASPDQYTFQVQGSADAVSVPMVAGQIDIALLPINLAAVLYNKTAGKVKLAAVNTLGVLYVVSNDDTVQQLSDLTGRTVLNTGKGTTPQFVLEKALTGIDDVTIDYRSQPTEVASVLSTTPNTIAVLPEPYVTAALDANIDVHIVADLNQAWQAATGSPLVTSCVAVRTDFADARPAAFTDFMTQYAASVAFTNDDPAEAAPLIVAQQLAPNEKVALDAIPRAHIVFMTGANAKIAVQAYLAVLFAADPASIGGTLPGDDFFMDVP